MDKPLFLGICQQALLHGDGISQDLFRVSNVLPLPFFPQSLAEIYLVLAMPKGLVSRSVRLTVINVARSADSGWIDMDLTTVAGPACARVSGPRRHFPQWAPGQKERFSGSAIMMHHSMEHVLMPVPCPHILIIEPTDVRIEATVDGERSVLGGFDCIFAPPIPITPAELSAIKSRPGAATQAVIDLACKECHDHLKVKTCLPGTERRSVITGALQLSQAPEIWKCRCGKLELPLQYLKRGFHDVFRRSPRRSANLATELVPLYERGAIAATLTEYQALLECNPSEEQVQEFLQSNQILWHFLSPSLILSKPQILTKKRADFAILTQSKILFIVEIEKPQTKLTKADGGVHSELQAGLDQIRDWRVIIQDHRAAFLASLELTADDVDDIRYMLIAGLASRTPPAHLMTLRRNPPTPTVLHCFDELASFLHATETSLGRL